MIETDLSALQQQTIDMLAAEYVGVSSTLKRIGGGRNSRIYRLSGENGSAYAVKIYFRQSADRRDRLGTEFRSLQFLWENGIRDIPRPFAIYPEAGIGVYEFIQGSKIVAEHIDVDDIDAAVDFAGRLKSLATHAQAHTFNPASEAFFSIEQVYQNIQSRLNRLRDGQSEQPDHALGIFLQHELVPTLERVAAWSRRRIDWTQKIPVAQRTLSPSDFGFHNAIRRGKLVFLDFEYFGWDDPAKLVADFILHPAMNLNRDLSRRFVHRISHYFDHSLQGRIESVYPLFGLKWSLICLNEFLPEHWQRRQFAATSIQDWALIRNQQLSRARHMIQRINQEYDKFPYFC